MADDTQAPHEAVVDIVGTGTLQDLLEQAARHCPRYENSCWVAHFGYNRADGEPLALVMRPWGWAPRILPRVDGSAPLSTYPETVEVFWALQRGSDPEALWHELSAASS
jgi:hypothetical protein